MSDRNSSVGELTSEFRQMIEHEVRQIELHGGDTVHKLKSSLYEKWVSELLDTIAVMSKHTLELEKVASASVNKLEQKVLDPEEGSFRPGRFTSTKLGDSGLGSHDVESGRSTNEDLVKRLQESSQFARQYLTKCNDLESKIQVLQEMNRELKERLLEKDQALVRLKGSSTEHSESIEKSRLQLELDTKVRELSHETSQRKKLEKRVCKQSEEIKALTQEVAAKHDQKLQQEQRTKEVQQQMEKLLQQNNYQNLLIDTLRKELKQKRADPEHAGTHNHVKKEAVEDAEGKNVKIVVEHQNEQCQQLQRSQNEQADMSKEQVSRLQARLQELECKLRGKEELISTLQAAAGPSRSQTLAHINKMTPDELKLSLLNKEKEISEQRTIIGQLQEALVDTKNRWDGQPFPEAELCFGVADISYCGHHHNCLGLRGFSQEQKLSAMLLEARRQLRFYEQHNRDLSLEVMRVRNDQTESELRLEQILKESELTAKKEQCCEASRSSCSSAIHATCTEQISRMQKCVEQGHEMLREKEARIGQLQAKLDEVCREAENQSRLLASTNLSLAALEEDLRQARTHRDGLLQRLESLQQQQQEPRLRAAEEQVSAWRQRYEIISRNLEQKEGAIEEMRRRHEEETSQAMAQTVDLRTLAAVEAEAQTLRAQLAQATAQLAESEARCRAAAAETHKLALDLRNSREEARNLAEQADKQAKKLEQLEAEMSSMSSGQEAREAEMKRLLRLSCENVQHLQALNQNLQLRAGSADLLEGRVRELEAAAAEAGRELEAARREATAARDDLDRLRAELAAAAEHAAQLQTQLAQAQQQRQQAADEAAALATELATQQAERAELAAQLHEQQLEKQHLERSQAQLEELCKTLSAQLGGQRHEREKYVRGLKQAAAERTQMCQEARQVLAVAREWLVEHRAHAVQLQQLKAERERLLKENNALRLRSRVQTTSMLNPWDCGLVDREESGFWSSHWTTQLDEVDQEIESVRRRTQSWPVDDDDEEDEDGVEGRGDNGYQSGYQSGSSK
ncbi:Hypothetical predicted protein [Cloeon dipterum]|uniref:Uncharacterized protein n=1 Tax=Cloeon dipterum TaxID=197152 RepID=A0A8S1E155_9INSE|nr:Hypothetical predicted protein [Cloeon dipterum]